MKSLVLYIQESLQRHIYEGGNAVTAEPIPAYIAPLIYEDIAKQIEKYNKNLKIAPLGSLGKKLDNQTTGDIDIAISIDNMDDIEKFVKELWPNAEYKRMDGLKVLSMSYPYDKEGVKGNAQIDFMMVKSLDWAKWRYDSPDFKKGESKYKAAVKDYLLRCIVGSIPVKDAKNEYFEDGTTVKKQWKYTFNTEGVFKQLLSYVGKNGKPKKSADKEFNELVSNDPKNVMTFILGETAKPEDFKSAESIWKAFHEKWPFGNEAMGKAEERFYNEFIYGKSSKVPLDTKDFPCKVYKHKE